MQAVIVRPGQAIFSPSAPNPSANAGETLLRVRLAGICGTDLAFLAGYGDFDGIGGHEFVAERVDDEGRVTGERVVADINIGCNTCPRCLRGDRHHCEARQVLGIRERAGAFAEWLVVPEDNLVPVPASLPDQTAVLAEPVAAALQILEQVAVTEISEALVIGAGRLGILVARVMADAGINVTQVVRNPARDAFVGDGVKLLRQIPATRSALVVECTGAPEMLAAALAATAPQGLLVLKSTYQQQPTIDAATVVVNEIRLLGSRCGPMEKAVDWLSSHPVEALTVNQLPLAAAGEAFAAAADTAQFKVAFCPLDN